MDDGSRPATGAGLRGSRRRRWVDGAANPGATPSGQETGSRPHTCRLVAGSARLVRTELALSTRPSIWHLHFTFLAVFPYAGSGNPGSIRMLSHFADQDALEKKRNELVAIAFSVLADRSLASDVVESLCRLSPPQDPPVIFEMISTRSMGASGGSSRKPGNILVSIGNLAGDFGDIGLTVAAGATDRSLIPLAALAIWSKVWARSKIELTRDQATLAYAMWVNREPGNLISIDEAREMHRLVCKSQGLPNPTDETFNAALSALTSIGSVESHKSGKIWLREWVSNSYS